MKLQSWQERRNLVLGSVERSGFGWWIVLVAGIGFLTDAYAVWMILFFDDNFRDFYQMVLVS